MKNKRIVFYVLNLLMFICLTTIAQEFPADSVNGTQELHVVIKNDGTEYIGKILKDDGREMLIQTMTIGKIYILKEDITTIKLVSDQDNEIKYGQYWNEGPFTTRYSFTTNALPIKKGENYAMVHLWGPEVHFAVSDNFSVGMISTWIGSPLGMAFKYTKKTKNEKINFALGTIIGYSGYLMNGAGYGGIHWATLTYGDREQNVSISAGYLYYNQRNVLSANNGTYTSTDGGFTYVAQNGTEYSSYNAWHTEGKGNVQHAPSISIGGISKVGARASIIFDAMVFAGTREVVSEDEIFTEGNFTNNNYVPAKYEYTVSRKNVTYASFYIMPGMRFQKTETKAFQICLSGLFNIEDGRVTSFPLPMLSWFRKF